MIGNDTARASVHTFELYTIQSTRNEEYIDGSSSVRSAAQCSFTWNHVFDDVKGLDMICQQRAEGPGINGIIDYDKNYGYYYR